MSATPVAAPAAAGVARGGAANLAGAAFAGLAGFGVTWLAARALGPVQAGGFFAATAAFTLAGTVAKLGTPTGLVYLLARLRARDASATALRQCVRTGVVPVAAASVVAAAVLWFAAAPAYATQSRVLAVFLPVAVLCDTLLAATRGWRRMRPTVMLDKLLRPALQLVLLGLLALSAVRAPAAYPLAWALPYVPVAILAGLALRRLLPREGGGEAFPARDFWRFTAPRALASVGGDGTKIGGRRVSSASPARLETSIHANGARMKRATPRHARFSNAGSSREVPPRATTSPPRRARAGTRGPGPAARRRG